MTGDPRREEAAREVLARRYAQLEDRAWGDLDGNDIAEYMPLARADLDAVLAALGPAITPVVGFDADQAIEHIARVLADFDGEEMSPDQAVREIQLHLAAIGPADHTACRAEIAAELRPPVRRITSALIAVEHRLTEPYPDDPRWTPWTRFVSPALKNLRAALDKIEKGAADA